jgi:hypothetical protein
LLTWAVVTIGIAALVRLLRKRKQTAEAPPEPPSGAAPSEDPAEELRRKIAESRAEPASASEATVEERRSEVQEQARSALEEMRSDDEA